MARGGSGGHAHRHRGGRLRPLLTPSPCGLRSPAWPPPLRVFLSPSPEPLPPPPSESPLPAGRPAFELVPPVPFNPNQGSHGSPGQPPLPPSAGGAEGGPCPQAACCEGHHELPRGGPGPASTHLQSGRAHSRPPSVPPFHSPKTGWRRPSAPQEGCVRDLPCGHSGTGGNELLFKRGLAALRNGNCLPNTGV